MSKANIIKYSFSNELVMSISKKTKIKPRLVVVILEIFVFIMKRTLIDENAFYVCTFGLFSLTTHKNSKWKRNLCVNFKSVDYMKSILRGIEEPRLEHSCDIKIFKKLKKISVVLGLSVDDFKYLFNLFFYNIIMQLMQNKVYKINRFGYLKIVNNPLLLKTTLSSILKSRYDTEINCKMIKFTPISSFKKEMNGKCLEIKTSIRAKRLLYNANEDLSIKQLI